MPLGEHEIENRFGFHKASIEGEGATTLKHKNLRIDFRNFAARLDELLPDGRDKDLMWDHLEDASMRSHKAIANTQPLIDE